MRQIILQLWYISSLFLNSEKTREAKRSWWSQIESSGAERLLNYITEGGLILTKMIWVS